jgi:outer membrane protein OmpA-like peptidoglycan-associated protein
MKKLITAICFATALLSTQTKAQNVDHPWILGLGFHAVDYTSAKPLFKDIYGFDHFQTIPAFSKFDIGRNINRSFAVGISLAASKVSHAGAASDTKETFIDADLLVKYLFANDYILKSDSWFDPYIAAGPGYSAYGNFKSLALNIGAGINFWANDNIGFNIQSMLNTGVKSSVQDYFHHSLGVVVRLGGKDSDGDGVLDRVDKCPTIPGLEKLDGCPDKDGDGIADNEDACPDIAGLAAFKGCPDSDGDGIADKDDACPNDKGTKELNGCPDKDGDGVADKDDKCPDVKGIAKFDGCPDTDGDGIQDKDDACPNDKGTSETKGCPDRDGDGVADKDDKCPDVKGLKNNNGCPAIDEAKKQEVLQKISFAAKSIQFETGKDIIKSVSFAKLDTVVNIMKTYESTNWSIEGHTDNVGDAAKNLDLSKRRAAAVKAYFINKGISGSRLSSEGYGDTKPAADNKTAAGRQTNRRVEIKLNE